MNKQQFKTSRSLYRYYLRHGGNLFTRKFNATFGFSESEVAFCDSGCVYSDSFSWVFGDRGSYRAQRIIYRNAENINFG